MSEELKDQDQSSFSGQELANSLVTSQIPEQAQAEFPKVTPEQIEAVTAQFSPRSEVDDQGLNRTIFEHQGITFAFMGREETPIYHTFEVSKPTYLGREPVTLAYTKEKPALTSDQRKYFADNGMAAEEIHAVEDKRVKEWQDEHDRLSGFVDKIHELDKLNADKPEHLIVEQSPYGIYSLLERLQPENPHWKDQREAVLHNQYDDETLRLIDMVTGVDAAMIDKNRPRDEDENHPPLGEAVVAAALLGDAKASNLADGAAKEQSEREARTQAKELADTLEWAESAKNLQGIEAYRPEDLVVVHATSYEPKWGARGYEVETTHDATGQPRATVHTAINHKVENATLAGNWDSKDYVLVAGLDHMLDVNGPPKSLNGADTWWSRNPGEHLVFPGGTLIGPSEDQTELVLKSDGKTSYKTKGFTEEDMNILTKSFPAAASRLAELMKDENGQPISSESEAGQRIIANTLRDALVRDEITNVRGKELMWQSDDKFMPEEIQRPITKMAAELGLGATSILHSGTQESDTEDMAARGHRVFGMYFSDPKVRRTAYASGMMAAGGISRQNYIAHRARLARHLD